MIRYPLQTLYSKNVTQTTSANYAFQLPVGDVNGLVVKYVLTTITATNPTLDFYFQTTDDGGTTYYDLCHFNQTAVITAKDAIWATIPVNIGDGSYIGDALGTSISANSVSHLPVLSPQLRLAAVIGGSSYTTFNAAFTVYANNQSGGQY